MDQEHRLTRLEFGNIAQGGESQVNKQRPPASPRDHYVTPSEDQLNKKRPPSSPQHHYVTPTKVKPPRLPLGPRQDLANAVQLIEKSGAVDEDYIPCFELELCGSYGVWQQKKSPKAIVLVRQRPRTVIQVTLSFLQDLKRCPHFLECFELFHTPDYLHLVYEYVDLNLVHIATVPSRLTLEQLASIAGQILSALRFLEEHRLQYTQLSMSTVLATRSGLLKLGEPELCHSLSASRADRRTLQAVGEIILKLAHTPNHDNSLTPRRDVPAQVVDFNGLAVSQNVTLSKLMQHEFLSTGWDQSNLAPLITLAAVCCYRSFRFCDGA
ncbi:hypothetical protein LTR05_008757 [Lithohypha guttulata]|uniref:Protein kinase domain-containing protein n=1 Tax=Lithohypha guttulata TaxID=1690604 RepID=A0AAN7SEK5_9EURO|nr:hypothetical protein LTR05_008757 [Lithohypha guttulata]